MRTVKKAGVLAAIIFAFYIGFGYNNDKPISYRTDGQPLPSRSEEIAQTAPQTPPFFRDASKIDYSGVAFNPWDIDAPAKLVSAREKKPYTIMLYMNGSDLESENGAATDDLIEMLESGVKSSNLNLVLFTGGTNRWQNDVIPENECALWEIKDGGIEKISGIGLRDMGDAGTLSSFIRFGMQNFPADNMGLILWDHGGGSIAGYGHDEKFDNSNLTLLDLNYAFEKAGLSENQLAFLGFDSCLMAAVEMAVVAAPYAHYLVASEDLEPGEGWNYSFLSKLNDSPNMDGKAVGIAIADSFMDYYGSRFSESLTLSVIELSRAAEVMDAMGNLTELCSESLLAERSASFKTLAKKRGQTKTFGVGGPRDSECDMVDIGDMAAKLSDLYPEKAAALLAALERAVPYNRHNSRTNLKGLSAYYIYGGKEYAGETLQTYDSLDMDKSYTGYLRSFSDILTSGPRQTRSGGGAGDSSASKTLTIWQKDKDGGFIMTGTKPLNLGGEAEIKSALNGAWPKLDNERVCLYPAGEGGLYAVPCNINGADADIMIRLSDDAPQGKVLGTRKEDGFIIQKGYDPIKDGDEIVLYRESRDLSGSPKGQSVWWKSPKIKVQGELKLTFSGLTGHEYYSVKETDVYLNESFSPPFPVGKP